MSGGLAVTVIGKEPGAPLVLRAAGALRAAGHPTRIGAPGEVSLGGPHVLCDDASLPKAVRRLTVLLPGRLVFPTAVACVEDEARAGGLVADGFRDVVTAAELPRAVDALLAARAPRYLAALRREVEQRLVPGLAGAIRERALEKHALLGECAELVRAGRYLEKRIFVLTRARDRQALDDVYLLQGKLERFLEGLLDERRPRVGRLPRLPGMKIRGTVLARHEPRLGKSRDEVDETLSTLRDAGLLAALGKGPESELLDAGEHLHDKPIDALRAMIKIVEREVAERVSRFERIEASIEPLAALEKECLPRYGVAIVAPGIALPEHLRKLLDAGFEPPPDVYLAYCLDLRDLELKRCAEVMEAIDRAREPGRERDQR